VPLGAYYQGHSSLSKAEIEIATNLTNGRWLAAYSNYEHEMIAEKDGGLPPEKVEALIADCLPTLTTPAASSLRSHVGFSCAPRLTHGHLSTRSKPVGPPRPYGFDRTHWIFHCVSLSLMAYDVPSSAIVYSVDVNFSFPLFTPSRRIIGESTVSAQTEMLGGRLPLLEPSALSQRKKRPTNGSIGHWIPWANDVPFQSKLEDGRLIGPFNPILFCPAISSSFLDLQENRAKEYVTEPARSAKW